VSTVSEWRGAVCVCVPAGFGMSAPRDFFRAWLSHAARLSSLKSLPCLSFCFLPFPSGFCLLALAPGLLPSPCESRLARKAGRGLGRWREGVRGEGPLREVEAKDRKQRRARERGTEEGDEYMGWWHAPLFPFPSLARLAQCTHAPSLRGATYSWGRPVLSARFMRGSVPAWTGVSCWRVALRFIRNLTKRRKLNPSIESASTFQLPARVTCSNVSGYSVAVAVDS